MKKIRVILSMLAIVLAIGGAIASTSIRTLDVAYEFVNDEQEPYCQPHPVECSTFNNSIPCTVTGVTSTLRLSPITSCGQELWKVVK
jgi:hypothetical protein